MARVAEGAANFAIQELSVASSPDKMTIGEAREFYELVAEWLQDSLRGLEEDEALGDKRGFEEDA